MYKLPLLLLLLACSAGSPPETHEEAMADPAHRNRLADETSPYLLQHADNPVDWYPWGEEALARARAEDKPIFLSIGYSTCHWCHVMAHESFENEATAALMNENFICIKVDREERPDLDEIYMNACQLMTGRGGWPLSVFLMPDLRPFFAGTYFPPEDRHGMRGFPSVLRMIAEVWKTRRDELENSAQQLNEALQGLSELPEGGELELDALLDRAFAELRGSFDARLGGWGSAPKFPRADYGALCLRRVFAEGEGEALRMLRTTLDAMANGGIYDQLGGGFHRYSTDAEWLAPHFEKMLYDNAQLALHYCESHQLTGNENDARIVRETLDYLLRDMRDPSGAFYSAEDADSEGEEGTFYVWSLEEIRQALDEGERDLFVAAYDVSASGNWEGHNILRRVKDDAQLASEFELSPRQLRAALAAARAKLLALRSRRPRPHRDDKVLAAWNGLAIEAFARAGHVLDDARYLDAARAAARFLIEEMHDGQTLYRSWRKGERGAVAYAEDYAFAIAGLLELYQCSFELVHLETALQLQREQDEYFGDPRGGYFHTRAESDDLIVRVKAGYDGSTPTANSVSARNLMRLFELSGELKFHERASGIWRTFAATLAARPMAMTHMLLALHSERGPRVELVLSGERDDPRLNELHRAAREGYHPDLSLAHATAESELLLPALAGKAADGVIRAFVCRDFSCLRPTEERVEMLAQLGLRRLK